MDNGSLFHIWGATKSGCDQMRVTGGRYDFIYIHSFFGNNSYTTFSPKGKKKKTQNVTIFTKSSKWRDVLTLAESFS